MTGSEPKLGESRVDFQNRKLGAKEESPKEFPGKKKTVKSK